MGTLAGFDENVISGTLESVVTCSHCYKCGGLIVMSGMGTLGYSGKLCCCPPSTPTKLRYGWVCSNCKKSNSPDKMACDCVGDIV